MNPKAKAGGESVEQRPTRRAFPGGAAAAALLTLATEPLARAMPLKKAELGTLDFASVGEAASVIRKRSIRSAELTQRMLDRIAKYNPRLNAVVNVISDQAMDEARRRDAVRLGEGGPPHGVPILVKDAFEIAGVPIAGLPSTAAPIGRTPQGLPVGVQILGPNFEDAMSIDFAARMAEVAGGFMAPPGFE